MAKSARPIPGCRSPCVPHGRTEFRLVAPLRPARAERGVRIAVNPGDGVVGASPLRRWARPGSEASEALEEYGPMTADSEAESQSGLGGGKGRR